MSVPCCLQAASVVARVPAGLDKCRPVLLQQAGGLAERIADTWPARAAGVAKDEEIETAAAVPSDFPGVQHVGFTGCRPIAEGKA